MYAVVANGIQTICKTQRQLDTIAAIYPYPKFRKFKEETEAREWLRQNTRSMNIISYNQYGETVSSGYAKIEYFIDADCVYYNIRTEKVGFIKIWCDEEDVKIDARRNLIKVRVCNLQLNNKLIFHHILAIRRILKLIGEYLDVDFVVPDSSILIAATKYTGSNYIIKGLQRDIAERLGGVSFTVKER